MHSIVQKSFRSVCKVFRTLPILYLSEPRRAQPIEPWAFIRVKNEIRLVEASLESISSVIKKGVIGYNLEDGETDDGTEDVIIKFCRSNPGFIPVRYNHLVIGPNDPACLDPELKLKNRLDAYYNAILEHIPVGEWFIKIDCDELYDPISLKQLMYLPKYDDEVILCPTLNCHYDEKELYFLKPIMKWSADHFLLKKTKKTTFNFIHGNIDGDFFSWEILDFKALGYPEEKLFYTGPVSCHFPCVKASRSVNEESLVPFTSKHFPSLFKLRNSISDHLLDKDRLLKLLRSISAN